MEKRTIIQIIKSYLAGIAFRVFLWGNELTEEQYWKEIYEQEKDYEYYNPGL